MRDSWWWCSWPRWCSWPACSTLSFLWIRNLRSWNHKQWNLLRKRLKGYCSISYPSCASVLFDEEFIAPVMSCQLGTVGSEHDTNFLPAVRVCLWFCSRPCALVDVLIAVPCARCAFAHGAEILTSVFGGHTFISCPQVKICLTVCALQFICLLNFLSNLLSLDTQLSFCPLGTHHQCDYNLNAQFNTSLICLSNFLISICWVCVAASTPISEPVK